MRENEECARNRWPFGPVIGSCWSRGRGRSSIRAGLAQRARIVLLAADGVANTEIAERVGVARPTVISWRERYAASGVEGLADEQRSGRPRTVDRAKILAATLTPPPAKLGVTHWSSRLLAEHLKVDASTVLRTWRHHRVKPWRAETFKFSTDPELVAKVTDVVGLYLAPPENAIVLCVDEKSPDPGVEPDPEDAADAARPCRATHPRLRPARHHHACSPPWRSPPARSPGCANRGTGTRSSWPSSTTSPAPTPTSNCT